MQSDARRAASRRQWCDRMPEGMAHADRDDGTGRVARFHDGDHRGSPAHPLAQRFQRIAARPSRRPRPESRLSGSPWLDAVPGTSSPPRMGPVGPMRASPGSQGNVKHVGGRCLPFELAVTVPCASQRSPASPAFLAAPPAGTAHVASRSSSSRSCSRSSCFCPSIALDFGRVFLGYINLQNMARIAANYAANNPDAWGSPADVAVQTRYENQMIADASATNCRPARHRRRARYPGSCLRRWQRRRPRDRAWRQRPGPADLRLRHYHAGDLGVPRQRPCGSRPSPTSP